MYVHYFDRYVKLPEENPTIGILLCKEKDDALVEITLPENSNIYASEYKLYLPDKKELQKKLQEWIAEEEGYTIKITETVEESLYLEIKIAGNLPALDGPGSFDQPQSMQCIDLL